MKNWHLNDVFVGAILFVILLVIPTIMVSVGSSLKKETIHEKVPKMEIFLNNIELESIKENSKEIIYHNNTVKLINDDAIYEYDGVDVKGRGNATWGQIKIPLQIKFPDKVNLLGLGKRRKWILLANFHDPNNLRTSTAYHIEEMLDMEYAYNGKFVDLYMNGSYEGLYYLVRGVEVGKNAVALKDPMGVLVELDNIYGKMEEKYYTSSNGEILTVKDAVAKDNTEAAMNDFLTEFNKMEMAIKNNDFAELEQIIDIESFAKYYLLSELIANTDAYFTSVYFHKDGPDDKIHAGPAWDFDIALDKGGTINPEEPFTKIEDFDIYNAPENQYGMRSKLFARLIEMPEFEAEVQKIFCEYLLGHKDDLLQHIKNDVKTINNSAVRDSKRWEKNNFANEVERMLRWINTRYEYIEREYANEAEI